MDSGKLGPTIETWTNEFCILNLKVKSFIFSQIKYYVLRYDHSVNQLGSELQMVLNFSLFTNNLAPNKSAVHKFLCTNWTRTNGPRTIKFRDKLTKEK